MSEETQAPAKKKRKIVLDERLQAYKGVWVFIEHERGHIHPVSLELLGEGRKLADSLAAELAGVVLSAPGDEAKEYCNSAFEYGAEDGKRVLLADDHTILREGTSADRQLRVFRETGDVPAVVQHVVNETRPSAA